MWLFLLKLYRCKNFFIVVDEGLLTFAKQFSAAHIRHDYEIQHELSCNGSGEES